MIKKLKTNIKINSTFNNSISNRMITVSELNKCDLKKHIFSGKKKFGERGLQNKL
jgi:hypothetical protein